LVSSLAFPKGESVHVEGRICGSSLKGTYRVQGNSMPVSCPHCNREFNTTRGIFGQDGEHLRDVHVQACPENPRNRCFCGRVFPNSTARDNHATTCEMNPANRFKCPYCPLEFVSQFGMTGLFRSDGRALRDTHASGCKDNPANKCFCGRVFPDAEARNTHAVKCELNPANCFQCQFCSCSFVTTYNMLGFCAQDGRSARDAHQLGCDKNPKNACFCGRIFTNPVARDKHAATCEGNPANRFNCPHCDRLFLTRFGVMGLVMSDGKTRRDSHEVGCEKNPANACFCGQRFLNPGLRDAHAVKCHMNPVNRFKCQYCSIEFVTKFGGVFTTLGSAERDAHVKVCRMNPANAACEHCNATFADAQGWLKCMEGCAQRRCATHRSMCSANPQNRCDCCGRSLLGNKRWFCKWDARKAREAHAKVCDVIPCTYEVVGADSDWLLLADHLQPVDFKAENLELEDAKLGGSELCPEIEEAAGRDAPSSGEAPVEVSHGSSSGEGDESPGGVWGAEDFHDAESNDGSESAEVDDDARSQSDVSGAAELVDEPRLGAICTQAANSLTSSSSSRLEMGADHWEEDEEEEVVEADLGCELDFLQPSAHA